MRAGYLQRLFDRVAALSPPAPLVAPAGPSTSPVALADQRLNDPTFANDFTFASVGLPAAEEEPMEPDVPHRLPGQSSSAADRPISPPFLSAPSKEAFVSDRITAPAVLPPADFAVPRVGQVFESDFVHPGTEEEAPEPELGPTDPPSHVSGKEGVENPPIREETVREARVGKVGRDQEAAPQDVQPGTVSERVEESVIESAPAEPEQRFETVKVSSSEEIGRPLVEPFMPEQPVEPSEVEPPTAEPAVKPPETVEVYPPEVKPELPQRIPEMPATVLEPTVTKEITRIVEKEVSPEEAPAAQRQVRPMTAAEASIIGPLPRRPRALTLFGLRRR